MRRSTSLFIAALFANAMMLLLALPSYALDDVDYGYRGGDYYADSYRPENGEHSSYDRPYLAYSYSARVKTDEPYTNVGYDDRGYGPPYGSYASSYGYGHHHARYPSWRRTCVYGPLHERKICDYEPPRCWKERECYVVYGRKYCRYFTRCAGGERRCRWAPNYHHGRSCAEPY